MNQKLIKQMRERPSISAKALNTWRPEIVAAADDDRSISMYDVVGEDWYDEGITLARTAGILRKLGEGDVVVNINSPGGDMFEGIAIYNLLKAHKGHITVNVLGMAASAASIIAMAGDTINIGKSAFLMIHNCWTYAVGNSQGFAQLSDELTQFDKGMAQIYVDKTGLNERRIIDMLDEETWLSGDDAIEMGFADGFLSSETETKKIEDNVNAVRRVETALRASGMPRSQAQKLISELKANLSESVSSSERDATERSLSDSTTVLSLLNSFKL